MLELFVQGKNALWQPPVFDPWRENCFKAEVAYRWHDLQWWCKAGSLLQLQMGESLNVVVLKNQMNEPSLCNN